MIKILTCLLVLLSAANVLAVPVWLIKDGKSDFSIITGKAPNDHFATSEFREIFKKATGVKFGDAGKKTIHIGLSTALEKAVGADRLASLRDGETLILEQGDDIYLIGGGERGTLYAVYDFVEKYLNYRCYAPYPGAESYRKVSNLQLDGQECSTFPAFPGYRLDFNYAKTEAEMRFMMRNRNNGEPYVLPKKSQIPNYRSEYFRVTAAQHGLLLFVPPKDLDLTPFLKVKWKGMFESHPEYFSMNASGQRVPNFQLCLSNPNLRKLLTERFLKVVSLNGKGVYMLGSNDNNNTRYCYCPECQKLIEKYKSNGGPLWDYILELCTALKQYPGTYLTSLAYKGPEQTELAPSGIKFPENFICDAAFLVTDRPLKEVPDIKLKDGSVFNRLENLKKWVSITDHVSYWYYAPNVPCQVVTRMKEELQEIREAGVKSVGACGTGGGVEFGDIAKYLYFQLLRNPNLDTEIVLNELLLHKYGVAAPAMRNYIKELEEEGIKSRALGAAVLGTEDTYDKMTFLPARKIVEWQRMFQLLEQDLRLKEVQRRNLAVARIGLDCWTIVFASKIRKECPDWEFDPEEILARGLKACTMAEQAGMIRKDKNPGRRVLESMQYYAYLKNDSLPPELSSLGKDHTIHRFLPEKPLPHLRKSCALIEDPQAAAGVAMTAVLKLPSEEKTLRIPVHFWAASDHKWLLPNTFINIEQLKKDQYAIVRLGESRLPRHCCMVFGNAWGTSVDIRSLGRYYDPSYHEKVYEYYVSVRVDGPAFYDTTDAKENRIWIDQIFLVDKGMPTP